MEYIKKHKFIIILFIIALIRLLLSFKLPLFYNGLMKYDDELMINQFDNLIKGNYLGNYSYSTLVKGFFYPLLLALSYIMKLNFSVFFTTLYILACIYLTSSLKKIINNKVFSFIFFIIILFNPISYSSDLFQRLYRNSISVSELLFFLGTIIRIVSDKKNKIINYFILGIILSIMYLTREDNIWTIPVLMLLFIYKLYKNIKIKNIIINLIPIIILIFSLNIVSFINYKYYGVYTYNELKNTNFKDAYINILRIKEDKKIDKVSINKETFYKLLDNIDIPGIDKKFIDKIYKKYADTSGEIDNGNMVWYFRNWIYINNKFKSGKEANEYFDKLNKEIERLFKEGKLETEFTIPSINFSTPTISELKKYPKSIAKAVLYTTTYQNVKTMPKIEETDRIKNIQYSKKYNIFSIEYRDYRHTDNIIDNNPIKYEIIRQIYMYLTIIFIVVSIIIYLKNIFKFDELNIIIDLILISYLVIILGVAYTDVTAFHAIRYMYLGNTYILQSLFILLNLYRLFTNKNVFFTKIKK